MPNLISTGLFTNTYERDNPELAKIRAAGPGGLVGVDRLYVARLAIVVRIRDGGDGLTRVDLKQA